LTTVLLGQTIQTDISIKSDTSEIKIRETNISYYFIDGVKVSPCDTIIFYNLINAQIKQLDHKAKDRYYISNTLNLNTDSLPRGKNYRFCEDKLSLSNIYSKKGTLINPDKYDGHSLMYNLYRPFFNTRLKYHIIKVRSSHGEWGGATVFYYYKKHGKKFKFVKKRVTSVS
jgi:hypothetical protein